MTFAYAVYKRLTLDLKTHTARKYGVEKDISWKCKQQQKAGVAILIPDKTDFKTKSIQESKKDPAISLLLEEIQKTKLKRHIHSYVHCSKYWQKPRYGSNLSVH